MTEEEADQPPTLRDLLRNLLDISTLPHLLLLAIVGFTLYAISTTDSMLAFGVAGFVGLSMGYALTAWLQGVGFVHRFSHVQPAPEDATFGERMKHYPVRVLASWLAPIMLAAIPFTIIAWYLTTPGGEDHVQPAAIILAGLFVIWSWMQGMAMATSLRIPVETRAARMEATLKESRLGASSTSHVLIISIFAALTYWLLVIGYEKEKSLTLGEMARLALFTLFAASVQMGLLKVTRERREIDASRRDTAAFGFTWGLLIQLFVTWHLLSALRRFTGGSWGFALMFEELLLMLMTVVAAIWTLAKGTHDKGLRIFTEDNAIFWGLSFGMAYAGSIAMIAVLGSDITGGDVTLAGAVGIGHLITAGTMMWLHWWRIGNIAAWLDDARSEEVVSDISEDDSEDDSEEDDDWGEAGWKSEEDVVDDSTASIPGAEVEWDIPEPVTAEDDEEDEVELV